MSRLNNVPPPPPAAARKQASRLGAVEVPAFAPDNLSTSSDKPTAQNMSDLNFKVDARFKKRFKAEAVLRGLSMKELLEASFREYLERHGGTIERPHEAIVEIN